MLGALSETKKIGPQNLGVVLVRHVKLCCGYKQPLKSQRLTIIKIYF